MTGEGPIEQKQLQSHFWDVASANASPAEAEVRALIDSLLSQPEWQGKTVLDGGCGNGDYSAAFLAGGAARVHGIDVSAGSLRTAREKAPGGIFFQASLSELPLPSDTVDILWSWGVLHYVPDPQAALQEIGRVLKPGGAAVIHTLGANVWSTVELSLAHVFSRSPRPVRSFVLDGGSRLIPLLTRARTGKDPSAQTAKSVRQKLQERLLVPGHQHTFTLEALQAGLGPLFTVTRAHPPVPDLLKRDMSLTILARKKGP